MNILILDDDKAVREMVSLIITNMKFTALEASDIDEAEDQLEQSDIAILDINLPSGSGYEFASHAREIKPDLGIVMLTVRKSVEDVVRGYIDGADVYLAKPFSVAELTAILFSLARRSYRLNPKLGNVHWQLNVFGRYLVTPSQNKAELTERETLFFELLSNSQRNIVSRKAFVESLGYDWLNFDDRRFDTFISRLRKRVRDQTGEELALKSDRRGNYYLLDLIDIQNN